MTDNDRNGPETAPLKKYITTFPIMVIVLNKDDIEIKKIRLDYGKHEDKLYLAKLSFWAWNEGYILESMSAAKYDSINK